MTRKEIENKAMVTIPLDMFNYLIKALPTVTSSSELKLYEEIQSTVTKPEVIESKIEKNPFTSSKRSYRKWTDLELRMIEYCAGTSTPSHNTLDYLKRKVNTSRSEESVVGKLYSLGYKIINGRITK